jgi:hypothetical protein
MPVMDVNQLHFWGQPVSAEIACSPDQLMSKEFPQVVGTLRGFQHLPGGEAKAFPTPIKIDAF